MTKISSRASFREFADILDRREAFETYGALRGGPRTPSLNGGPSIGRMDPEHPEARIVRAADYVVWSYSTPVAWHTPIGWQTTNQSYSVTTSRHVSKIAAAISVL